MFVHVIGAAIYGAITTLWTRRPLNGVVIGTFAGVGLAVGLVVVALLRSGWIVLYPDEGDGPDIDYVAPKPPPPPPPTSS